MCSSHDFIIELEIVAHNVRGVGGWVGGTTVESHEGGAVAAITSAKSMPNETDSSSESVLGTWHSPRFVALLLLSRRKPNGNRLNIYNIRYDTVPCRGSACVVYNNRCGAVSQAP